MIAAQGRKQAAGIQQKCKFWKKIRAQNSTFDYIGGQKEREALSVENKAFGCLADKKKKHLTDPYIKHLQIKIISKPSRPLTVCFIQWILHLNLYNLWNTILLQFVEYTLLPSVSRLTLNRFIMWIHILYLCSDHVIPHTYTPNSEQQRLGRDDQFNMRPTAGVPMRTQPYGLEIEFMKCYCIWAAVFANNQCSSSISKQEHCNWI